MTVETMWMYVVTIALGVCFSVLTFYYVYLKIRPKFPIRVNCWFCNQYSVVPYDNRNCWDCVHCDQYNGFSGDGGYNKVIPAQHDELLNHSESAKALKKGKGGAPQDALCRRCSINQQLKIQQLAAFSATNPHSFDQEVEEYRLHLERAYQLCSACERVLKQRLSQQQGWLLGLYRRELYSRKLQETSAGGAEQGGSAPEGCWLSLWMWASRMLTLTPLPLAPLLMGAHAHSLAPTMLAPFFSADALWLLSTVTRHESLVCVGGSVMMAAAAALRMFRLHHSSLSGAALTSVDVLAPVLWAAAAAHVFLLDTGALGEGVAVADRALARLVLLVVVMALNAVAAFRPQEAFSTKTSITFPSRAPSEIKVNGKRHMAEIFNSLPCCSPEPSERSSSSLSFPPLSLSVSCPVPASSTPSSSSSPPSSSTPPPPSPLTPSYPSDAEELEWSLGRLRLGGGASPSVTVRSRRTPWGRRSAPAFVSWSSPAPAPRTLTPASTTLFRPAHLPLRHVTQASWVAGGYWGALGPPSPSPAPLSSSGASWTYGFVPRGSPLTEDSVAALSRCSSQSSGFHSRSSASPGCASASVCGGASSDDGAASTALPTPPPANRPAANCLQRPWPTWWWSPAAAAAPWCFCPPVAAAAAAPQCRWPGSGSDVSGGGCGRNVRASPPKDSSDGRSVALTQWLLSPWLLVLSIACTFANAAVLCATLVAFKDRLFA